MSSFAMDKFSCLHLRLAFINNESIRVMKHHEEKRRRPEIDPADIAKVRKVLFGPVDQEANTKFFEEQIKRLDVIEKERWNFDFKKEEPVNNEDGFYKWSKDSPKKPRLLAPKPRRLGQQKVTDYLTVKKSAGEPSQKKLKLILDAIKDEDQEKMVGCN